MQIELSSSCLLHLGFVRSTDGALCELGMTLQHPQIQMTARPTEAPLQISGARADAAWHYAEQFLDQQCLPLQGEIEIEIAVPANMGLGSDAMLDASLQQLFSGWHNLPGHHRMTLAECACRQGGLLMTDDGLLRERSTISHTDDERDWVFVLALPNTDDDVPDSFEVERTRTLRAAAVHLNPNTHEASQALWQAVKQDDIAAFAKALAQIHAANELALANAGTPSTPSAEANTILKIMRDNGALMCAQTLTGLGLYALVQGRQASRTLRDVFKQHYGYFGPLITATICDNAGVKMKVIG